MSICLVTTLKESVSDDSLLRLDEYLFHVKDGNVFGMCILPTAGKTVTLTIRGNGHFTDSAGTANYGKTTEIASGVYNANNVFFSPGDYDVVISGKFDIIVFAVYGASFASQNRRLEADISELRFTNISRFSLFYCTEVYGEVDDLDLSKVTYLGFQRASKITLEKPYADASKVTHVNFSECPSVKFDINSLQNNNVLVNVWLGGTKSIGNLSSLTGKTMYNVALYDTDVTGNLSAFSGCPNLEGIDIHNTAITGALVTLAQNVPGLKTLNIDNTVIYGNTSDLAGLQNLTTFTYANCPNITGTWPLT